MKIRLFKRKWNNDTDDTIIEVREDRATRIILPQNPRKLQVLTEPGYRGKSSAELDALGFREVKESSHGK